MSIITATPFLMSNAQAASCKIPKSYYKNVSCTASSGYFLAIKDFGAPVALIDRQGKSVVDLSRYQKVDADKISGGLLPVLRNGRVGYVNMQGRETIPAMYDMLKESQGWARPVSEGRIVVKQNGHYGVIDTANKTIVPFSAAISDIDDYRSGMTRVRKNQAISWLDKNGKPTRDPNSNSQADSQTSTTNENVKEIQQSAPSSPFTTLQPRQQDGRWGFVDDNNVTMITYSFDEVRPFSEGLAGVRIDNEWGFVNLGGELVIPFRFDKSGVSVGDSYKDQPAFVFTSGKAWIGNLKNGTKMCIDKEGSSVGCD
ncbi:WG repeat-containing protein [Psychrobacter maritimus]|uniref:WG repeat-containing protein n=1 Tax=Psychrobacter maritimus TaxID=256325 RepID=UPI003567E033